jgi:hypothetical protein
VKSIVRIPYDKTVNNESYLVVGGGGEVYTSSNKIGIVGSYTTLYLRNNNYSFRSVMIHCNGNILYITTNTGSHIFALSTPTQEIEQMRIGPNIPK